ncbi:pyridoxamine 5'-phosphate oxidase [Amycolatopsis sp. WAC 01416]|uniref:pyridoxamine 5'-phosphate oxidase family protein n=1 Tax=Amycolatopsis sp. WAC 01416 TaxID=2203196 RepID=UPI000F789FBE|nr:pyridoxamine 5'-phosphate oxidase family protein [Amycolatopsis sp. WAC 01416]RSN35727.1 pyridoxamine 5'-phosphate oxidase [Amycolatopsis sp. WAC 01416]
MGTSEIKVIETHEALREHLGHPKETTKGKIIPFLDPHARTLIEHSPFYLLATASADGTCDVSPRGDPAGSVKVLDDKTLVLADRPGNKLLDSQTNILENPHAGLLFVIPGMNETLRINGGAKLVADAPFFDDLVVKGKRPALAILVEVEELYIHCAKAFLRSSLWKPETWPERSSLPTAGQIFRDQMKLDMTAEALDAALTEGALTTQY